MWKKDYFAFLGLKYFILYLLSQDNKWCAIILQGVPAGSIHKESACNAGDPGLIPGSGRSPGEGNGNPLQ